MLAPFVLNKLTTPIPLGRAWDMQSRPLDYRMVEVLHCDT